MNGSANENDLGYAVTIDGSGAVLVTGYISHRSSTVEDLYVARYDGADGHVLWTNEATNVAGPEAGLAIAADAEGNAIVTGYWPGMGGFRDIRTAKFAAGTGDLLWSKSYDAAQREDTGYALAVDSAGNVFITGRSTGATTDGDYYSAKYAAADGRLLWERRYNSAANGSDERLGLALDRAGNPIVTGNVTISNTSMELYTRAADER